MGRQSRAKRERRAQRPRLRLGCRRSAARRALLHLPASSEASERVAYCPACGGITLGMQASGPYDGLIFGLPRTCPNCDQPTEIITCGPLCVARSPRLHLTLDKRYTRRKQQTDLETSIRSALASIPENVVVMETRNSEAVPELQAADFVAWAFGQKYEHGDASFAELLSARVLVEEKLK